MEVKSSAATHLPYKVLSKIMVYAYKYILGADGVALDLQLVPPPIIASHVCHSWRHALLSDPSMWSCFVIPRIKPSGVLELLRRSDSALLNVSLVLSGNLKVDYDDTPDMLSCLFSQIHRFKLLHVDVNIEPSPSYAHFAVNSRDRLQGLVEQVLPYLRQPAPELQTFRFKYTNLDRRLEETFLDTLFSGDAPNLERLHHTLSYDFRELSCPLFRDLSELYLALPYEFALDFSRFLDLLELSPCLELFRLYVAWDWHVWLSPKFISDRKINLQHLRRLVLEVNTAVELLPLILEHVVPSPDFKWHIDLQYQLEFTTSSLSFSQLVSQAYFTSLHMTFNDADFVYLSFEENHTRQYINQFNDNKLMYTHEDTADLTYFWGPLIHSVNASSITRLDIEVEATLKYAELPKIFATLQNLVFLSIKQESSVDFNDVNEVEPCVACLLALTPSIEQFQTSNHDTNATTVVDTMLKQDSHLNLSKAPCPHLRELIVELSRSRFNETHASLVHTCYDRRRQAGYPLQISIRCPEINVGVKSDIVASMFQMLALDND